MTVERITNVAGPFRGDGINDLWDFKFRVDKPEELFVYRRNWATKVDTEVPRSTYSVTGIGRDDEQGGTVRYPIQGAPLSPLEGIVIKRIVQYVQREKISNNGGFYPQVLEQALDYLTFQVQQLASTTARAVLVPDGEKPISFNAVTPGFLIYIDSEGNVRSSETPDMEKSLREAGDQRLQSQLDAFLVRLDNTEYFMLIQVERAREYADLARGYRDESQQQIEEMAPQVFNFTGDGTTRTFDTEEEWLNDPNLTMVFIGGQYQRKEQYEVADGVITFNSAPANGALIQVNVVPRITMVSAIPTDKSVTAAKIHDSLRRQLATWGNIYEQHSTTVNGTQLIGGGFPRSAGQELNDIFTGGNRLDKFNPQVGVDVGECIFLPPTEDSTNYTYPTTPWISIGGGMRRVMPVDIRTNLFNTPVGPALFEPVMVNGSGILSFRYIGELPIHTVLKGNIQILMRTSATVSTPFARLILRLRAINPPQLEMGQNMGIRHLAGPIGVLLDSQRIKDYREFNDPCFPINDTLINAAVSGSWPDYFAGFDNGFFNPGDTSEALRTSDDQGPVGPEVRTTKWMDISGNDNLTHAYFLNCTGTTSRRRVQYKNAAGEISTFHPMSVDSWGARGVYRIPADAVAVRIYYSGRGDTADNVEFIRISTNLSPEYDPLKGFWSYRDLGVMRDIVLWPGTEYYFDLYTTVYDGATARDWGFRYQSGGLSFLFDAGAMKKELASKIFRRM